MADEAVYFVAVRTTPDRGGAEVQDALKALHEGGLLPEMPVSGFPHAVAWYRPYSEMTATDHHALCQLGLEFDDANRIATIVSVSDATA